MSIPLTLLAILGSTVLAIAWFTQPNNRGLIVFASIVLAYGLIK